MEKGHLGVYQLMITSKYFDSINDFKNLELATKKAKGNMEKFHYNPIPLDRETRKYFTSLETLNIYRKGDEEFRDEHFYKRIIHYRISYEEYLEKKQEEDEYVTVCLSEKQTKGMDEIPPGVTEIGDLCFYMNRSKELVIPNTVTSIGTFSFFSMHQLTKLVLSTNLKIIEPRCFCDLPLLKEIIIPNSVSCISGFFFDQCPQLTAMTIPTHWKLVGNRFMNNLPFFCSFELPRSVIKLNGEIVERQQLEQFTIPTFVRSISKCCFFYCESLKSIDIPSSVRTICCNAFEGCSSLTSITIPSSKIQFGQGCFRNSGITKENHPELPDDCFFSFIDFIV